MRRISATLLAFLVAAATLQARTGDWKAVENLAPGTGIIVKARRNYVCAFEGVMDDQLVCETQKPRSFGTITVTIPRTDIREVRLVPNQAKSAEIGAGIGAGAGAVFSASTSRTSRGANAFLGAVAGGASGALVGAIVPVVRSVLHRQKVIYRR